MPQVVQPILLEMEVLGEEEDLQGVEEEGVEEPSPQVVEVVVAEAS